MAVREYDVTFNYNELSNVGTVGENVICDSGRENMIHGGQANNSEDIYLLSRPSSPECANCDHTKHASVKLKRCNRTSSSKAGVRVGKMTNFSTGRCKQKSQQTLNNKNSGKIVSHHRVKKRTFFKAKIVPKSRKPSFKTQTCETYNFRSSAFEQEANGKELPVLGPVADTKLLVSQLVLAALKTHQNVTKTNTLPITPVISPPHLTNRELSLRPMMADAESVLEQTPVSVITPSHLINPASSLQPMMADAVLKHTSAHASKSSMTSDHLKYPARSTWPLLREMIARPPVSAVCINSASRQTLSTVLTDTMNSKKPKANVMSKLDKEIRCECKLNKGEPCWVLFQEDRLRKERLHHLTLKRESLDLVILAKIAANINREEKTKKYRDQDRQRCRVCYYHEGRQICRETFMFIHGICKGRLCALIQHYKKKGLSVRVHGNKSNVPQHALSYTDSERVLDFIREYANDHSISSFGRKPGSKAGGGLLVMSPTQSKLYVHHKYKMWCSRNCHRAVSLRSFQNLWTKHLPYIVVLRGSNKKPVPEGKSEETVLEVHGRVEHEGELVLADKSSSPITNNVTHTLKDTESQRNKRVKLVHCSTNTPLHFHSIGRKKAKRKRLPPRKLGTSSTLPPSSAGHDFGHNENCDESYVVLTPADSVHNSFNNISVQGNSSDENIPQNTLNQPDMHHSIFNSNPHFSESSSTSPLQDHPTAAMDCHNQAKAAKSTLTTNTIYSCSNMTSTSTTDNLQPSLYMPQPSLPSDPTFSMQALGGIAPHISGSHALGDPSHSVLNSHQGSDFSNMHQIDWQTWQTYCTL